MKILEKTSKKRPWKHFELYKKEQKKQKKSCGLNSISLNVDSNLLDNIDILLTLERLVDHGIISSKLYAGRKTYKLSTIICDIMAYSIHNYISYIVEANSKRPIRGRNN